MKSTGASQQAMQIYGNQWSERGRLWEDSALTSAAHGGQRGRWGERPRMHGLSQNQPQKGRGWDGRTNIVTINNPIYAIRGGLYCITLFENTSKTCLSMVGSRHELCLQGKANSITCRPITLKLSPRTHLHGKTLIIQAFLQLINHHFHYLCPSLICSFERGSHLTQMHFRDELVLAG